MNFPKKLGKFSNRFPQLRSFFTSDNFRFSPNPPPLLLLLIFYLVLILFPANLAQHFILPESYIFGLLVDYLVPAMYFTELLVLFLLLFGRRGMFKSKPLLFLVFFFLASLLPSLLVGLATPLWFISLERFLRLSLWFFFALWVAENVRWEERTKLFLVLGLGVTWVSLLALGQFFLQREVFGYWFFGEPILSSVGGLAKTSLGGSEVLRAYGTFPHPNVLGGVLSVILVWLFSARLWGPFLAGLGGLLVSFSKLAIVSLIGGLVGIALFTQVFGSNFSFLIFDLSFIDDPSITRRLDLLESAWGMFQSAPLTGVGLGQFTAHLPDFGVPSGLTLFLQPVHNIFVLIAAESGLPALTAFLLLLAAAFRETVLKRRWILTISLVQLLFLGFFDHYLYTFPQGLFLLSLILGLSFSYSRD